MNNPDWNLLKSFITVVEVGSLSVAAKKLKRSQPTIGRHIEQLETELDIQLFDRTASGYRVTELGIELAKEVSEMSKHASRISNIVHTKSGDLSGTVRISASQIIACHYLPRVILNLRKKYPEIQYEISSTDDIENLLERDADIALRKVCPIQKDLITKKICDLDIGLYVAKSYPRFKEVKKQLVENNLEKIFEFDLIGQDSLSEIIDGFAKRGIKSDKEQFSFRADDHLLHYELVKEGVGIGFCFNFIANNEKRIVRLFKDIPFTSVPIWLTTHREIKTNAKIRVVFEELSKVPSFE
jgi:DNA-binding transcriptional LysR family regulator